MTILGNIFSECNTMVDLDHDGVADDGAHNPLPVAGKQTWHLPGKLCGLSRKNSGERETEVHSTEHKANEVGEKNVVRALMEW